MYIKFIALSVLLSLGSFLSFAQTEHYFLIGAHVDLIKTDNDRFFDKAQAGAEVNYYFSRKFTVTTGLEYWTSDKASWVLGARWFPIDDAYFRVRGLLGEGDISLGGGWAKPLNENLRLEAMADIYFSGHMAIRVGIAYAIRKKQVE